MADDGIWTTNASIAAKAGANVNATAITTAETDKYVLQVENFVNCATRNNWSDAYAALNVDVKDILLEVTSNLCAIYAISYDMRNYSSRTEAEDMINILRDAALRGISVLRDKKTQAFMNGA